MSSSKSDFSITDLQVQEVLGLEGTSEHCCDQCHVPHLFQYRCTSASELQLAKPSRVEAGLSAGISEESLL